MVEEQKVINITGINNRYMMKKVIKPTSETKNKKRVDSEKWDFSEECYQYAYQLNMINDIYANNLSYVNDVSKIAIQQINKKVSSYKQQDILKNHFDETKFLKIENVIQKMIDCQLKCRYCTCEMSVLYDISREMTQWSVDRVDNDLGHNYDNFHLACLECNLKRRRRTDEKFLFTKQLKIVKQEKLES